MAQSLYADGRHDITTICKKLSVSRATLYPTSCLPPVSMRGLQKNRRDSRPALNQSCRSGVSDDPRTSESCGRARTAPAQVHLRSVPTLLNHNPAKADATATPQSSTPKPKSWQSRCPSTSKSWGNSGQTYTSATTSSWERIAGRRTGPYKWRSHPVSTMWHR